jgi:uroporphyrinogen-III synthase
MDIVLTREAGRNEEARAWLPIDADVHEVPLTATIYFAIDEVIRHLQTMPEYGTYKVLVVTSRRSADYIHAAQGALGDGAKVLSVGPATTRALFHRGVAVAGEGTSSALELAGLITEGPVLMVGAAVTHEELSHELLGRQIAVTKVACYETLPAELSNEQAEVLRSADVVLIGAPSAWSRAREIVADGAWIIVPGASTGEVVAQDHPRVLVGWGPSLCETLATFNL